MCSNIIFLKVVYTIRMKYAFVWLLSMLIIALLGSSLTKSNQQIEGLTSKNKKKSKKSSEILYNEDESDDESDNESDDESDEDDSDDEDKNDKKIETYSKMTKKPGLVKTVLSAVNDWWE